MDAEQDYAYVSLKPDMDVDANNEHAQLCIVENFTSKIVGAVEGETITLVLGDRFEGIIIQLSYSSRDNLSGLPDMVLVEEKKMVIDTVDGVAEDYIAAEVTKENPNFGGSTKLSGSHKWRWWLEKARRFCLRKCCNDDCTDDVMQAFDGEGGGEFGWE